MRAAPEQPSQAERRLRSRRMGAAYQGAFEAVFAILIAVLAGRWADEKLGTSPWLLLLGFVIGFGSFVLRLVRLGRKLEELAREAARETGSGPPCEAPPPKSSPPTAGPTR